MLPMKPKSLEYDCLIGVLKTVECNQLTWYTRALLFKKNLKLEVDVSVSNQTVMTRDAIIYRELTDATFPTELVHLVAGYDGNPLPLVPHGAGHVTHHFDQKISPNLVARIMASFATIYTEPRGKWYVIKMALIAQRFEFIAVDCAMYGVHLAVRRIFDDKYKKALYEKDLKTAEMALRYGCHNDLRFDDILKLIAAENYEALILLMAQAFNGKEPKAFDAFKSSLGLIVNFPDGDDRPVLEAIPNLTSAKCFTFFTLFLRYHLPTTYYPVKGCPDIDSTDALERYSAEKTEKEIPRFISNIFDRHLKEKNYKSAQLFLDYGWDPNQIMQACASSNNDLATQAPLKIFTAECTVDMLQFWLANGLNPSIEIRHPRSNTPLTLLGEATKNNNLSVISFLLQYNPHSEERKNDDDLASLSL
jgi:hypothetical protein